MGQTDQKQISAPIINSGNPIQVEISKFWSTHIDVPNHIAVAKKIAAIINPGYKEESNKE